MTTTDTRSVLESEAARLRLEIGPIPVVELDIVPRWLIEPIAEFCDCGEEHEQAVTCDVWWDAPDPVNPRDHDRTSHLLVRACVPSVVRWAAQLAEHRVTVELGVFREPVMVPLLRLPWRQDRPA